MRSSSYIEIFILGQKSKAAMFTLGIKTFIRNILTTTNFVC